MNFPADFSLWAVIPAAGVGARMESDRPKQYLPMRGRYLLDITLDKVLGLSGVEGVVVAVNREDPYWPSSAFADHPRVHRVEGGSERSDSVLNALHFCQRQCHSAAGAWALVHDAARPCVTREKMRWLIERALTEKQRSNTSGALLAVPAADTVKRVTSGSLIERTEDRSQLWLAHTPQIFPVVELVAALEKCRARDIVVTDEASAVEACGGRVEVVPDRRDNIKVTVPEDLAWAEMILQQQEAQS